MELKSLISQAYTMPEFSAISVKILSSRLLSSSSLFGKCGDVTVYVLIGTTFKTSYTWCI